MSSNFLQLGLLHQLLTDFENTGISNNLVMTASLGHVIKVIIGYTCCKHHHDVATAAAAGADDDDA